MSKGPGSRTRHRQTVWAINVTSILLSVLIIFGIGVVWKKGGLTGDFKGTGNGNMTLVEVAPGSSLSDLSEELVEKKVVKTTEAFMRAANDNHRSNELQPGFYRLEEQMSAQAAVDALLSAKNQAGLLDIPTGTRMEDINVVASSDVRKGVFTLISEATCIGERECVSREQLKDAAANTDPAALGVPTWAIDRVKARGSDPRRLEGLIIPGVHHINPQDDPVKILSKLVSDSAKRYEETGLMSSAEAVKLSPYDLITAASLIQMEAPEGDFDKVGRVILNRLAKPMRMQFDSTVNYDLKDQEIATTDTDRGRVTPWNTYAKDGLPETPIAAPSLKAIKAMENPAPGTWLYFVTVDKQGKTIFSTSFEEHNAAIEESRRNGVLDSNR